MATTITASQRVTVLNRSTTVESPYDYELVAVLLNWLNVLFRVLLLITSSPVWHPIPSLAG